MADQWDRMVRRTNERLLLIAQEAYTVSAAKVIERSPVDTGLFRNNWFSGLNSPSIKTTTAKARKRFGEPGGARFQEFLELSTKFRIGDTLFLTNSLPYARRLEFGHSLRMAPLGMVRVTAAEWPRTVSVIARKIT